MRELNVEEVLLLLLLLAGKLDQYRQLVTKGSEIRGVDLPYMYA